jgi:hypothetical protein
MRSENEGTVGEATTRTVVDVPVRDIAMGSGQAEEDNDDDDGSDFEMPTLTAELSSDDED